MPQIIGMGDFVYEHHGDWARFPPGRGFQVPSGVAVDSQDRVYAYQREGPRVLVFDRDGYLLTEWPRPKGAGEDAHLIYVSPDDGVFLADRDAHQVLKYNTEGELLMTLGTENRAVMQAPFNHPSDIGVAPSGDIYITDGYGNASVHRFSADGKHISSFGSTGRGPGQFNVPHSVRISKDGRVFVADRENDRVQIFTPEGEYLDQWTDFERPAGVHIDANQIVYVTDHIPRVSFYNLEGELLARGRIFEHGHNIFSDSRGDFYVADVRDAKIKKFVKL